MWAAVCSALCRSHTALVKLRAELWGGQSTSGLKMSEKSFKKPSENPEPYSSRPSPSSSSSSDCSLQGSAQWIIALHLTPASSSITPTCPPLLHSWPFSVVFLFSPAGQDHVQYSLYNIPMIPPLHTVPASLTLSQNCSIWAVPLIYSFLILSMLVLFLHCFCSLRLHCSPLITA